MLYRTKTVRCRGLEQYAVAPCRGMLPAMLRAGVAAIVWGCSARTALA